MNGVVKICVLNMFIPLMKGLVEWQSVGNEGNSPFNGLLLTAANVIRMLPQTYSRASLPWAWLNFEN